MAPEAPEKKVDDLISKEQGEFEVKKKREQDKLKRKIDKGLDNLQEKELEFFLLSKMNKKTLEECTEEEQEGIEELTNYIDDKIKKITRVPLDITINSFLGNLVNKVQVFSGLFGGQANNNGNLSYSEQQEKMVEETVDKYEGVYNKISDGIAGIAEQFKLGDAGLDISEIQNAMTVLSNNIMALKSDKKKLKELAKLDKKSVKDYYKIQIRKYKNDFMVMLKGGTPDQTSQVDTKQPGVETTKTPEQIRTDTVEGFIAKAEKYKGYEYERGGQGGGDKMDCSGLIYAAWKDMGITNNPEFERTTAAVLYDKKVDKISDIKNAKRGDLLFHRAKVASPNYNVGDIRHVMIALSGVKNDNDGKGEYIDILDSRETKTNNNQAGNGNQDVGVRKQYLSDSDNEILAGTPTKSYEAMASMVNTTHDIADNDNGSEGDYDDLEYPTADPNLDDLKYIATSDMVLVEKMRSGIIEKNPKTGTTLCSKTAADNIERLGVKGIQRGNAFDVKDMYGEKYKTGQKIGDAEIVSIQEKFTNDIKGNTFDIFIPAKSEKNKVYGHRLVGFRSEPSNQIYVLDPYNVKENGKSSTQPMKIEDFIKNICEPQKRDIVKIVGYTTPKKVVDNQQVITQIKQQRGSTNV